MWRTSEFPRIQNKNDNFTSVMSVDASDAFKATEDWTKGSDGEILLPYVDANDLPNPTSRKRGNTLVVRDTACEIVSSTSISVSTTPSPTPTPSLSPVKKECHGVSGYKWVISRDVAAQNAADFCKQKSNTVEYESSHRTFQPKHLNSRN